MQRRIHRSLAKLEHAIAQFGKSGDERIAVSRAGAKCGKYHRVDMAAKRLARRFRAPPFVFSVESHGSDKEERRCPMSR
jgi:hypothetical protein